MSTSAVISKRRSCISLTSVGPFPDKGDSGRHVALIDRAFLTQWSMLAFGMAFSLRAFFELHKLYLDWHTIKAPREVVREI